jgi:hypothetical protein
MMAHAYAHRTPHTHTTHARARAHEHARTHTHALNHTCVRRYLADTSSPKSWRGGYEPPNLFVDVKLKDGSFDRISVCRGDDIGQLSLAFAQKHGLEEALKAKLELLLRHKVADNELQ